jgi:hypothetical protein
MRGDFIMEKNYIYVVLTRTNTVISKLINLIKNDKYTHAAISLDKELNSMYGFGRKHSFNPFFGVFRKEELNKGVYKYHKNLPGAIIEIEVTKDQYENAKNLLNEFINNSDKYKYNYMGLIDGILNKEICYENKFICSEFVYHILKESNIADFKISRNLVRPQNFMNLESKIIYEGNLKELENINRNYNTKELTVRRLNASYE